MSRTEGIMDYLYHSNTEIKDGFWKYYADLNRDVTVHAVRDRFEETYRFAAFACDWKEGDDEAKKPHVFWDSDIAKWMEGVAYMTEMKVEPELEAKVDEVADLIEKNQLENGYFNCHFIAVEPDKIFTWRGCHELYCTGHLIEAAIAYHKATGKDKLLKCMLKNVDYIYQRFVIDKDTAFVTPGHQEIELALIKLYDYTGDKKHLELANFFLDKRGNNDGETLDAYNQSHIPVREQSEAVGHSVRALYLYTAMAMAAKRNNDAEMLDACHRLFDDVVNKKMHITGGVGSLREGEKFSYEYDLPNANTYNETCAAIALSMFAAAMCEIEPRGIYGDVVERVFYNGFISGLSLSGDHFFYTNPTEIDLKKNTRSGDWHPISQRVKVFGCSCCPPNVVRFLGSIPRYAYGKDADTVYCHQFIYGVTKLTVGGKDAELTLKTAYPLDGKLTFTYKGEPMTLKVRIPDWCVEYTGETENGFATFEMKDGDTVTLDLPMNVHLIEANPLVQDNSGRYAVTRGPVVYCLEGVDNGENLRDITITSSAAEVKTEDGIPAPVLYLPAERRAASDSLFRLKDDTRIPFTAKLIPYLAFANRGDTDMLIWVMAK